MAALTVGTFVHVMTPPVDVRRGLGWSGCRCGVQSAVTSAMAVRVADSWTMALSPRRRQPTDRSSSSTSSGGWPTKRWDTASILFQAVASRHVPTELAELRRSQYTAAPDARVLATAAHNVAALKTALTEAFQDHPDAPILMSFPGSLSSVAACSENRRGSNRFRDRTRAKAYAGTAPVTRFSGTKGISPCGWYATNDSTTRPTCRHSTNPAFRRRQSAL